MILASGERSNCLVDIFVTLEVGTAQQIKAKHGSCHELMLRLRPETEVQLVLSRLKFDIEINLKFQSRAK